MRRAGGVAAAALALGALVLMGREVLENGAPGAESPSAATASEPVRASLGGNRLAGEASPYLQLHAHNPVDWYPWGEEAFRRAREESKPIFLSVGYSTCYWCHVMEREVFSNQEIAALMNRDFINIKVDREERPDVDELYMTAAHLLTGSGGWPNSVFLTPKGEPFFAGSYFPPEERHGRPAFPRVLAHLAGLWKNDRERLLEVSARVAQAMRAAVGSRPPLAASQDPVSALQRAVDEMAESYDGEHGGFSSRTKFPSPPRLEILLTAHGRNGDERALEMLTHTLDAMALGGIHDHLAGGFHRYSTEPTWSVPHFEKMLYDNAQLLGLYARAFARTGRPLYRQVAEGIARYLAREMTHPEGGLYSAQDAEVEGREGASYVWTSTEIQSVLGEDEAQDFLTVYQLSPIHDVPGGVLRVRLPVESALGRFSEKDVAGLLARFAPQREKLLAVRNRRPQPRRDEKVLAAWNGLAIRGLVDAGAALGNPDLLAAAGRAARFVLDRLRSDGRLHRSYVAGRRREAAVLDDYAFLADGLLGLHATTGEERWRTEARALVDRMISEFQDAENGGFFLTGLGSRLLFRTRSLEDQAEPSGNGVALRVLSQLARSTGGDAYAVSRQRSLEAHADLFARAPSAIGTALSGLFLSDSPPGPVPPRFGSLPALPQSDDHVRVELAAGKKAPGDLRIELHIDPGWHVNANPASEGFLIPTQVSLESGGKLSEVFYPPGHAFQGDFGLGALSVYDGRVEIPMVVEPGDGPLVLDVRYQACDEVRCLPPSTTRVTVPEPE